MRNMNVYYWLLFLTAISIFSCDKITKDTIDLSAYSELTLDTCSMTALDKKDTVFPRLPAGYKILKHFTVDIDNDLSDELVIHYITNKQTPCWLLEDTNCFVNEIVVFENKDKSWTKILVNDLANPLIVDNKHLSSIEIDSLNNLIVKSTSAPSGYSHVSCNQFFEFKSGNWYLNRLDQTIFTKSGSEFHSWDYHLDLKNKLCTRTYETFSFDNDTKDLKETTQWSIKIDSMPLLTNDNSLEDLIQKERLNYWY